MSGKPLTLADKHFPSKDAAKKYFSKYLKEHNSIDAADYPAIHALFQQHQGLEDATIVRVEIAVNRQYAPVNSFLVTYMVGDETIVDFKSYKTAVDGYSRNTEITKQFRDAIAPQIMYYKKTHEIPEVCHCCKGGFLKDLNPEVDHYPVHFCDILKEFMRESGYTYDNLPTNNRHKITKPQILSDFAKFHKQRATYRIICRECNAKSFYNPTMGNCIVSYGNNDEII